MNDSQTLQDLVLEAKRKRDTSMRQLAFAAQEHGFKITYTTLHGIGAGTYKSTARDETVRAIAWLAGVSVRDAFTAAGLPVPGPPFADELPPGVDKLSPKARKAVIELLRVLVDEEAGEEREDSSAPMNPAGVNPVADEDQWHTMRLEGEMEVTAVGDQLFGEALARDNVDWDGRPDEAARGAEKQDYSRAARTGTPGAMPDTTTGEESQDVGSDEPV